MADGAEPPEAPELAGWRARTVDRSLEDHRTRVLDRSERFILAAMELVQEVGTEFKVQDLVKRARSSLRAFYRHFSGKDELMLAAFEEMNRTLVEVFVANRPAGEDPIDELREFVTGLMELVHETPASRALVLYHLSLAESRPDEFRSALEPMHELAQSLLRDASHTERVRSDMRPEVLASILVSTVVTTIHLSLLGADREDERATSDELWRFLAAGLAPTS